MDDNWKPADTGYTQTYTGRWPANVVLDETTAPLLDQQSGTLAAGNRPRVRNADDNRTAYGAFAGQQELKEQRMDAGGASRFFKVAKSDEHGAISEFFPREFDAPFMYAAKAPKKERPVVDGVAHSTVKPLSVMKWLVKLVTPPGGTVLEPFAGSGTTVEACLIEGFKCIAVERESDYLPLIMSRIDRQAGTLPAAA
jgi:site-specific DNA-methyltransferase (adenine-specific)